MATRGALVGVLVFALIVSACGGGEEGAAADISDTISDDVGGDPGTGSSTGTEVELEDAARAAFEAFQSSADTDYFDALSRRCRELGFPAVEAHLDGRRLNIGVAGIDLQSLSAGTVTIDGFDGQSASVSVVIEGTTETFRESLPTRWVNEEGSWRIDDCSDIRPAANDLSAEGTDPGDAIEYGFIADLEGWLINQSWANLDDEEIVVEFGGEAAPEGSRIVTTGVSLTYTGPEASIRPGDVLEFALVSGSTVYGPDESCETDEYGTSLAMAEPVAPGDSSTTAVVCRVVAEPDVGGLLLRVTHIPTGGERWFRMDQT